MIIRNKKEMKVILYMVWLTDDIGDAEVGGQGAIEPVFNGAQIRWVAYVDGIV